MPTDKKQELVLLNSVKCADFNDTILEKCKLNILIGKNTFAYCLIDEKNIISALTAFQINVDNNQSFLNVISKCISQHNLLAGKYRKINIGIQTPEHCLMANDLIDENIIEKQHNSIIPINNTNTDAQTKLLRSEVKNEDYLVTFKLLNDTINFINKFWTNANIKHAYAAYLSSLVHENSVTSPKRIYVNLFEADFVDIVLLHHGKIKFANTFKVNNKEELLYYILKVGKQFYFDFETGHVYYSGILDELEKYFNFINVYIKHLHTFNIPSHLQACTNILKINSTSYYNLYCL